MTTPSPTKPAVTLHLTLSGSALPPLTFTLEDSVLPQTCSNFRSLLPRYVGTRFHRVIKGFMAQGGDYTAGDGTGGESFEGGKFKDEAFGVVKHDKRGVLSMANSGPDTNGSQFFVTLGPCRHLDGKHVAFGRVTGGMEVLDKLDGVETDERDRPVALETVKIVEAYEGERRKRRREEEEDEDEDEGGEAQRERKKKKKKKKKKKDSKKDKKSKKKHKKKHKKSKKKHKKDSKKKSQRSSSSSSSGSDSDSDSSSSSSSDDGALRSSITGKKIRMHIEKDEDDLMREKARKEMLQFMNST
eukprot:CAMPEP_0182455142 /NCGR_PEP_ID=MMETSP1319-20130603/1444_1 /TAXON_ID=172717 /ORGANISM="Bolidomonas pacifica, Strain RCC208" /LENGTH=299 /DNA_ID=CAMNT_0024653179 /DNA_START=69 /DNA_END=968 /DNA_ORIENTATION=+